MARLPHESAASTMQPVQRQGSTAVSRNARATVAAVLTSAPEKARTSPRKYSTSDVHQGRGKGNQNEDVQEDDQEEDDEQPMELTLSDISQSESEGCVEDEELELEHVDDELVEVRRSRRQDRDPEQHDEDTGDNGVERNQEDEVLVLRAAIACETELADPTIPRSLVWAAIARACGHDRFASGAHVVNRIIGLQQRKHHGHGRLSGQLKYLLAQYQAVKERAPVRLYNPRLHKPQSELPEFQRRLVKKLSRLPGFTSRPQAHVTGDSSNVEQVSKQTAAKKKTHLRRSARVETATNLLKEREQAAIPKDANSNHEGVASIVSQLSRGQKRKHVSHGTTTVDNPPQDSVDTHETKRTRTTLNNQHRASSDHKSGSQATVTADRAIGRLQGTNISDAQHERGVEHCTELRSTMEMLKDEREANKRETAMLVEALTKQQERLLEMLKKEQEDRRHEFEAMMKMVTRSLFREAQEPQAHS